MLEISDFFWSISLFTFVCVCLYGSVPKKRNSAVQNKVRDIEPSLWCLYTCCSPPIKLS